jgi:predicted glycogen debranching enzyme
MLTFGRQVCGDLRAASEREWLVCDGCGGYAMGTVAGLRTRRYHGLLVVSGEQLSARHVGLAALDVVVVIGDHHVRLATDEWAGGVVDPAGHEQLSRFDLADGIPRWQWSVDGVVVERELAMQHGRSLVGVTHRVVACNQPVRLEITALCTWRDAHGERFAGADPLVEPTSDGFVFERAYRVAGPGWIPGGSWFRGAYLRAEAARGLGATEDLWAAGRFTATLAAGQSLHIVAVAAPFEGMLPSAAAVVDEARSRARQVVAQAKPADAVRTQLVLAADQFVVRSARGPAVVAGYPWFGDWARDTMTSYEGLFLATNRVEEGRELLLHSLATLSEGMLANTADTGSMEYNTADGTLWFIHAVARHVAYTQDTDLASAVVDSLHDVIRHHVAGTRFNIGVDPADGLLRQGAPAVALTWMDARVDGHVITPRRGKAVEVNALWINALGAVGTLDTLLGRNERWAALESQARESFTKRFVRPDGAGLFDVIDAPDTHVPDSDVPDTAVRPNQLLAVSLPYGPGGPESIVGVSRAELLTSVGMRSLAPSNAAYRGHHQGDVHARDAAYHQGTVWPWLIGPYVDACDHFGIPTDGVLDGLETHLAEWGLGSVSETLDGDAPHVATGCPFQAWSVAEVLRVRQ